MVDVPVGILPHIAPQGGAFATIRLNNSEAKNVGVRTWEPEREGDYLGPFR